MLTTHNLNQEFRKEMSNNLSLNLNSNSISGFGGLAGYFGGFSSGTVEVVGLIGFSESANIKTAGKNKVLKHRRMKQIVYELSMLSQSTNIHIAISAGD